MSLYALYRQLPELVPGAYRLLANLLSAGKLSPRPITSARSAVCLTTGAPPMDGENSPPIDGCPLMYSTLILMEQT